MSNNISDLKSDLEFAIKLKQELLNLADNYFSIFKWLTNMSMALLGFYIALLLQLKFTGVEITSTFSIMLIVMLLVSTLLGLFYNTLYEGLSIQDKFEQLHVLHKIYSDTEKFDSADARKRLLDQKLKLLSNKMLGIHFGLFLLSLIGVTTYLIKILFS